MVPTTKTQGVKRFLTTPLYCTIAVLVLLFTACSNGTDTTTTSTTSKATDTHAGSTNHYGIASLDGWQVSLFSKGTAEYSHPDSAVVDGDHVFLDYQNNTAKDGTDHLTSTIVEYTMDGKVVKTFKASGHSDGMRMDPTTKLLWVVSNEDGNPVFETIDPASGTVTPYEFPKPPHGGGYDDVYFLNGMSFISASAPTLNKDGNNVFPALDKITLSNGKIVLTPILMGNADATDTTNGANNANVSLNMTDPDSLSTDGKGNLIVVDQGDSQIIMLTNPGTPHQKVSRLTVGSQLDDTVWATSKHGRLLVVDGTINETFWLSIPEFTVGTVYTQTPDDSGVIGLIGAVDMSTGFVTPVAIGFTKPTGMLFVPSN
ncbi:MAG: hypothetical protein NVSMB49_27110 [Ktedonobacteraceae bacterium]